MTTLMKGKLEAIKEVQSLLQRRGISSEIRRPAAKGGG